MGDIYTLFKDMLQELLEAEMDSSIGYTKNNKQDSDSENKRNGYTPKTVKSQYGEFQVDIPRDRAGEFEPKMGYFWYRRKSHLTLCQGNDHQRHP